MTIPATWSPIETYTALYIRAVRTRGYNKSLYSFVSAFETSFYIRNQANAIMRGFIKSGLLNRKSRQRYTWNREGKYILVDEVHEFVKQSLRQEKFQVHTDKRR